MDDECPICHQFLHNPASTDCGHPACNDCLLIWAATSEGSAQPLAAETFDKVVSSTKLCIDGLVFTCPYCRTEKTKATIDASRQLALQAKYQTTPRESPRRESETQDYEHDTARTMALMVGNRHQNVPPSISPYSGKIRTHRWTFFVSVSHPELVESVDVILHDSFCGRRFITMRQPPFTTSQLGWGYFPMAAFVTLRDDCGWEWQDTAAVNRSQTGKGTKDRLLVYWMLDFVGNGSQKIMSLGLRRVEDADEILASLEGLFTEPVTRRTQDIPV